MNSLEKQALIPYFHSEIELLCNDGSYVPINKLTPKHILMCPTNDNENMESSIFAIIEMKTYNNDAMFVYNSDKCNCVMCSPNIIFIAENNSKSFEIINMPSNKVFIIILNEGNCVVSKNYFFNIPSISRMTENNKNYFESTAFKNDLERFDNFPYKILNCSYFNFKMLDNKIVMFLSDFREFWFIQRLRLKQINDYTPIEKFIASLHQSISIN